MRPPCISLSIRRGCKPGAAVNLSLALLLCGAASGFAQADALFDPTRPAPQWLAVQPQVPGAQPVAQPVTPGVQIVVIGRSRKFAMVDGQIVQHGQTHDGARLVGIDQDGVVWQRGSTRERTSMTPGIEKKPSAAQGRLQGSHKSDKNAVNGERQ